MQFRASGRDHCVKQRHPLATSKIGPIIYHISETCKIRRKLLLLTHRKSHTCFPLVPNLVTLNDLERRNGRYFSLFRGICPLPRTHPRKILATPMRMAEAYISIVKMASRLSGLIYVRLFLHYHTLRRIHALALENHFNCPLCALSLIHI